MTTATRPNLFTYATSELSQDAFICWLAKWADPVYKETDLTLHQAGQRFVLSMIRKVRSAYEIVNIQTVDIKRQAEKLDVLIEINKELANKLAILVEDKTHTSNDSDQLNRYHTQVQKSGYTPDQMVPLYFKTGYQSRFDAIGEYKTYLRHDLLEVLREGKRNGVVNAIYDDFLAHLEGMDSAIRQFSTKSAAWEYHDWIGFFTVLYNQRSSTEPITDNGANWGYVANPSGGFVGYWWYFKPLTNRGFTPYLQLEHERLCFKIKVEDQANRSAARDEAKRQVIEAASQLGIAVDKPDRMGSGTYMTVACFKQDYRVFANGQLDLDATLAQLKLAQRVADVAFS